AGGHQSPRPARRGRADGQRRRRHGAAFVAPVFGAQSPAHDGGRRNARCAPHQRDPRSTADPHRKWRHRRSHRHAAQSAAEPAIMLDWLFPSPSERRLLGEARLRGATAWGIAIMSFSIVIIGAAGLALANTAGVLTRAIEARYSIQVPAGGGNVE